MQVVSWIANHTRAAWTHNTITNSGDKKTITKNVQHISYIFRPVVALIEIEIQSLDKEKEADVHDDVMKSMGPADPTVIINSLNNDEEINTEELLSELERIGNTVLVRWEGDQVESAEVEIYVFLSFWEPGFRLKNFCERLQ